MVVGGGFAAKDVTVCERVSSREREGCTWNTELLGSPEQAGI
jgi:hypothetical protein